MYGCRKKKGRKPRVKGGPTRLRPQADSVAEGSTEEAFGIRASVIQIMADAAFPVPDSLPEVLKDFVREILSDQGMHLGSAFLLIYLIYSYTRRQQHEI